MCSVICCKIRLLCMLFNDVEMFGFYLFVLAFFKNIFITTTQSLLKTKLFCHSPLGLIWGWIGMSCTSGYSFGGRMEGAIYI